MARALTKRKSGGELYVRPPAIEAAIKRALEQDPRQLAEYARITNEEAQHFLPSEVLVYLVREGKRSGNLGTMNNLLPRLLERCTSLIGARVSEEVREDILQTFAVKFAEDGTGESPDELDFFEVRFNLAFRAFRTDALRRDERAAQGHAPLPDGADSDEELSIHEAADQLSELLRAPPTPEEGILRRELKAKLLEAVRSLPKEEKRAVVLHYWLGYDIESDTPEKQTVATRCDVTGRTIRNRLTRANAKLDAALKEEQ